jgi:RHS repeat-associated protein
LSQKGAIGLCRIVSRTTARLFGRERTILDAECVPDQPNSTTAPLRFPFASGLGQLSRGGLHDRDLGFVRFGWRDYDVRTGRWTAPDPIGDKGGDPDWYGYCLDDPVNGEDPLGLFKWNRPIGRILNKGFDRSAQMAGGGAVAGATGGLGAVPGAVAGGMIGFPVGMLEATIKEAWSRYKGFKDDPLNDALEKSTDEKENAFDESKKYEWKQFKGQ